MSTKMRLFAETMMALAGLVFFFAALQQRMVNEAACAIDAVIAGVMFFPILRSMNRLERADD